MFGLSLCVGAAMNWGPVQGVSHLRHKIVGIGSGTAVTPDRPLKQRYGWWIYISYIYILFELHIHIIQTSQEIPADDEQVVKCGNVIASGNK